MTTSRPLTLAALALTTTLTMSACSSTSNSPSGNDSTPATASPSPTAAESNAPTVPADWQTVKLGDVAELSVPPDWTIDSANASLRTLAAPVDKSGFPPSSATVGVGNLAGGDETEQFDWMANRDMKTNYAGYSPKRLPDEVINGTTFYRIQFESGGAWSDVYGTVTPDGEYSIGIEWKSLKTIDRKQAEAIWRPVMPTFKML